MLIIYEFSIFGFDKIILACQKFNVTPILLSSSLERFRKYYPDIIPNMQAFEINTQNSDEAIEFISKNLDCSKLKGIINGLDVSSACGAKVGAHFGLLTNPPDTIDIIRNKDKLRVHCDAYKIPSIPAIKVRRLEELEIFSKKLNKDLIIKDANGSGSRDVYKISKGSNINQLANLFIKGKNWIVEEFIYGVLYSAEMLSFRGKHQFIGITSRVLSPLPYFQEIGAAFPALITPELEKKITAYILHLLDSLKFECGFSHIEFMLVNGEPILVEINPRIGGAYVGNMISLSLEHNIYENMLMASIGLEPFLSTIEFKGGCAVICVHNEKIGTITQINGLDKIKYYNNSWYFATKDVGDVINSVGNESSRCGVILTHDSNSQLAYNKARAISNFIEIEVEA